MAKKKKLPKDMTTDELAKHLFHPKLLQHLRNLTAEKPAEGAKRRKKQATEAL